MQEFCRYPDLLRHSSSFIEHFARTFLAGCVKAINLFLRGNPSRSVSGPIVNGSGSVTVMTVALAFKAFAKAIPCLTPFLATSDPSVLKRILAYIRGLPCSSNIFSKKVILTYMVRSSFYGAIVAVEARQTVPYLSGCLV